MKLSDIATIIKGWKMPYAYYEFENTAPEPPYVVYFLDESDDFFADNINYQKNRTLYIELYCASKKNSLAQEAVIESSLITNEMPFTKANDYISSERLYVTVYTMEVCYEQQ